MRTNAQASGEADARLIGNTRDLGPQVRLIDTREEIPESQRNRIVTQDEAHRIRVDSGLDLIMVTKDSNPPVIKLIDYNKMRFHEEKARREITKKQRAQDRGLKEFYFGLNINQHDYEVKLRHIIDALDNHYQVRIGVKNNYDTRMALPRGKTLSDVARAEDFIIARVIHELGDRIRPTQIKASDSSILADIRAK